VPPWGPEQCQVGCLRQGGTQGGTGMGNGNANSEGAIAMCSVQA
jgi:hypothetical protein